MDATGPDDVWVSGGNYLGHWVGSSWDVIPAADPPVDPPWHVTMTLFYDLRVISDQDIWAVGTFDAQTDSGGYDRQPLIEHWNGKRWSFPPLRHEVSLSYLFDIDQASPQDIWAVGTVDKGYEGDTLVERWDGTSWSAQSTSYGVGYNDQLRGVAALTPDDVWATGYLRSGR